MIRKISEASVVISLFRYLFRSYSFLWQKINYVYRNSWTFRLAKRFWERIKICFKYSFLGRITETKQISYGILENSKLVQHLYNSYRKWKVKIIRQIQFSSTADIAEDTKKDLYSFPVRIISVIVITAVTISMILSFVLQKEISPWDWIMRGLLLFVAISGLICKADWQTIKKNSVFLKKL